MLFAGIYSNIRNDVRVNPPIHGDLRTLADMLGLERDDLEISGARSLKEITVYTCIKILGETLGKLPLKIYQNINGQRKAADHYLGYYLRLRPNPYMSAIDFWKCIETLRNIYGNAYVWLDIAPTGMIRGLYPLNSTLVQIWCDDIGLINSTNKVWYIYTDRIGGQHRIESDEIMHFKGLTTDGIVGLSPIEALRKTIENSKSSTVFLNNSYKGGGTTKGIVHYTGDLDKDSEETFRNSWDRMSSGLSNANKISLLPIGYKYEPIAMTMTDAQFLENTQMSVQQLTAAFGIKPHQVNDLTKSSYATVSESNREFYTDTVMANLAVYEQECAYKAFTPQELMQLGFYVKFNADVILRGDQEARYNGYAKAVQNMIKTPNECRALEEDEPKDGGELLYGNGNLCPATLLAKGINYTKNNGGNTNNG